MSDYDAADVPGFSLLEWYGRRAGLLVSLNYRLFWSLDFDRARRHLHVCAGPLEVSAWCNR